LERRVPGSIDIFSFQGSIARTSQIVASTQFN